jgi:hypothetical protein
MGRPLHILEKERFAPARTFGFGIGIPADLQYRRHLPPDGLHFSGPPEGADKIL